MSRSTSFCVGVSERVGRHADAVRIPARAVQVVTAAIPGLTPTGGVPFAFEAEARQAWANVRKALLAAGASLSDIVTVRTWLTSAGDVCEYLEVFDRLVEHDPVTSLVVVDRLLDPQMRVQIEVTAVLPTSDG